VRRNKYLENLNRIEFLVTLDCTGRCKHCSEGDHPFSGTYLDAKAAEDVVFKVAALYKIESVMTFGGEPLMYPECVYSVHGAARECGIPKRQLITNGFFSKNPEKIKEVARNISECGVNDLLLSVDAFHQETIPLETVKPFATELVALGVKVRTNPAWLVSREDCNVYNIETAKILNEFTSLGIREGEGNVIFPEGNALKYLTEYFDTDKEYINPYEDDPCNIRSFSVEPDGRVLGKNIFEEDILDILREYKPTEN